MPSRSDLSRNRSLGGRSRASRCAVCLLIHPLRERLCRRVVPHMAWRMPSPFNGSHGRSSALYTGEGMLDEGPGLEVEALCYSFRAGSSPCLRSRRRGTSRPVARYPPSAITVVLSDGGLRRVRQHPCLACPSRWPGTGRLSTWSPGISRRPGR